MLKLPLALLILAAGSCSAQDIHPLAELQGTSRVLIVFAPDTNSASFKRQLQLIERHGYELTQRNTVVMPVSLAGPGTGDHFSGENLPLSTTGEQADARTRFHVKPGDFLVVLLNQDGTEQIRSASPVDIHELTAKLDSMPRH
jgi:Domain of unknown function (DUF4174)